MITFMKFNLKKIIYTYSQWLFFLLCLASLSLSAQSSKVRQADILFESLNYKKAASIYKEAYDKGVIDQQLLERLGDCYYYNTDMKNAQLWYTKLINNYSKKVDAEYYFRYAHALQGIGKHQEAKHWMKRFSQTKNGTTTDIRVLDYNSAQTKLDSILSIHSAYNLVNVAVNTENSDFGVGYFDSDLIFASSGYSNSGQSYHWNDQPFLNLYKGTPNVDYTDILDAKLFSKSLTSKYHESNAVFTKDMKRVYFTRNNYSHGLGKDKQGVNHLKLYTATLKKQTSSKIVWDNVQELPFNSDDYSVGHPCLANDDKKLYFTSDMPGSIGSTDIFVVDILRENQYSEPMNLGSDINTTSREMFPFVFDDKLYFASDGHLGFGGLDIFTAGLKDCDSEDKTVEVYNMGTPINSTKDDFSLVFHKSYGTGYLSSNRDGGKGDDDIYAVITDAKIQDQMDKARLGNLDPTVAKKSCQQYIEGVVRDLKTNERISQVELVLIDHLGVEIANTISDLKGNYKFKDNPLDCNVRYEVKAIKKGYESSIKPTLTQAIPDGVTYLPLGLEKLNPLIVEEKGILKLKIGMIYFDLDKHFIRPDAAVELNKIVLVMSQYPKMHIKIESHTDARMPHKYNDDLSDRRAKSTQAYLISQGIASDRIESAKGYGERQLLNRCADGVRCSEKEHQYNRRSEFIITKM